MGGYVVQPGEINGAGFGIRLGARLIDLLVHYIASLVFGFGLGVLIALVAAAKHVPIQAALAPMRHTPIIAYVFAILGSACYHVICEGMHGSTVGKRMLGLVVLNEDGNPCSLWPAVIRTLGYYVDALFFGLVAWHAMSRNVQEQRYGDEWAHTVVTFRKEVSAERLRGNGRFFGVLFFALFADLVFLTASVLVRFFV